MQCFWVKAAIQYYKAFRVFLREKEVLLAYLLVEADILLFETVKLAAADPAQTCLDI